MQTISGRSRCPLCGEILWATDDAIGLRPWAGTGALEGFTSSVCHYDCFLRSPFRDRYLAIARAAESERLGRDQADGFLEVLAENGRFAVLRRRSGVELQALGHGRVFPIDDADEATSLAALLEGDAPEGAAGAFTLRRDRGLRLVRADTAYCSIVVDHAEAEALLAWSGDSLEQPPEGEVDLAAALRARAIRPRAASCPPERAVGEWVDASLDPRTGAVELRLRVPSETTLALTEDERTGLAGLLRSLDPDAAD